MMSLSRAAPSAPSSNAQGDNRRVTFTLYITAVFLYWMALYLYVPTLPVYAHSKSGNLAVVGVIISMYGLWQAIIRLPLGITADWLGWRKPFIVSGFVLAGLGAWIMGVAEDANDLVVGRAITGLAAGTWVPLVVVFSSLFPPEQAVRATAILALVNSVGRMLATGVTGTLNELGGYSLAFFMATGAAALAILVVLPAQEKRRPPKAPSVASIAHLITRRDVLIPSLLSAVTHYATWTATFGLIPILARDLGATDVTISILTSMNIGVVTLGNLLATAIAHRTGAKRLVYVSFTLIFLALGGAALAPNLLVVFVAQGCYGLAVGIGNPVLMGMSIQQVIDRERTTAMGLHQAVYAIGMFGGPVLSGALADAIGIQPMFGMTAFICLAAGLFGTRWLSDPQKK